MEKLKFINEQFEAIGIPYEFTQWSSAVKYPYYVGELTEEPIAVESGLEESTLLVTGFHRGQLLTMMEDVERIKKHFPPIYGLRGETESGAAIAVFFERAFSIPSGEAGMSKVQINLKIKIWKGAM